MPDRGLLDELRQILALNVNRVGKARRIAETIRQAGSYRWVGVYDVDMRRGCVSNVAWSGPSAPAYPTFPVSTGLTGRAIAKKKTVNVGDVASDAAYLTALESTRSEIIIPVMADDGNVVGSIDVESENANAFDPSAQALLEECAQAVRAFWAADLR